MCWALAQVIGKIALREIDSLSFNTIRFSAGTVVIGMVLYASGLVGPISLDLPFLAAVLSGFLGWFVATIIYFEVLKRDAAHRIIPSGNAYPFWAIFLGILVLGEPFKIVIPISAALIFLGTFLLSQREIEGVEGWKFGVPLASLVAFLWGLNAILNKFALKGGMSPYSVLLVRIVSAVAFFWVAFFIRSRSFDFSGRSLKLSAISGIISFPIGSLLYILALSFEKASVLAPLTGGTVFFGFLFSIVLLDERPTAEAAGGMLAILSGILLMAV